MINSKLAWEGEVMSKRTAHRHRSYRRQTFGMKATGARRDNRCSRLGSPGRLEGQRRQQPEGRRRLRLSPLFAFSCCGASGLGIIYCLSFSSIPRRSIPTLGLESGLEGRMGQRHTRGMISLGDGRRRINLKSTNCWARARDWQPVRLVVKDRGLWFRPERGESDSL